MTVSSEWISQFFRSRGSRSKPAKSEAPELTIEILFFASGFLSAFLNELRGTVMTSLWLRIERVRWDSKLNLKWGRIVVTQGIFQRRRFVSGKKGTRNLPGQSM